MYLLPIPTFADNYSGLLHHGKRALVVNPGAADQVLRVLKRQALQLESILVTHHQSDDLAGLPCTRAGHQPFFACTPSVHQSCCAAL